MSQIDNPAANPQDNRVRNFRSQLSLYSDHEIVRRYITYGSCIHLSKNQYLHLKNCIAKYFHIHPSEVVVVGSAKLGFSIAPNKRYKIFNDVSDIDVAIVSSRMFDIVWKEVFTYSSETTYWPKQSEFAKYLSRGWIRPDKLPRGKSFAFTQEWDAFFRSLSHTKDFGEYPIKAGLYKDWLYLENIKKKASQVVSLMKGIEMKTTATNRRLRELLIEITNKTLIPRPDFQRRLVWMSKHKTAFIQTVLESLPFPEIYIAAGNVDLETGKGTLLLVDGQQRVSTLYDYFHGSSELRLGKSLLPYSKLSIENKRQFLEYSVVVRDLGSLEINQTKEVFTRINSTQYSLNAMEVDNARYDGEFKIVSDKLSKSYFFEETKFFSPNEIRRMGDLRFILSIMITMLSQYFHRDDSLGEYLDKFNDDLPEGDDLAKRFRSVISFIRDCNFPDKSLFWKKADFFTAFIELDYLMHVAKQILVPSVVVETLETFYIKVDEFIEKSESLSAEIMKYGRATLQDTNDRSNRISRGTVVRNLLNTLDKPKLL